MLYGITQCPVAWLTWEELKTIQDRHSQSRTKHVLIAQDVVNLVSGRGGLLTTSMIMEAFLKAEGLEEVVGDGLEEKLEQLAPPASGTPLTSGQRERLEQLMMWEEEEQKRLMQASARDLRAHRRSENKSMFEQEGEIEDELEDFKALRMKTLQGQRKQERLTEIYENKKQAMLDRGKAGHSMKVYLNPESAPTSLYVNNSW